MTYLDQAALVWFGFWSAITLFAFGYDKWKSGRSGQRVSEKTLLILSGIGGWIGGLVGMTLFRHKTAKWTFKLKFALVAIPFAAELFAWLHWR